MAEQLEARYPDIDVEMIPSGGGAFEIRREGELIFSKNRVGRFPNDDEVFAIIDD